MRIDDSEGNIILNIGEAKTEFRDSGIPSEFFGLIFIYLLHLVIYKIL